MCESSIAFDWGRFARGCSALLAAASVLVLLTGLPGCGRTDRELAPITGKVFYNGKPLKFGAVMIEHEYGQPATAAIQPDGAFTMATRGEGEGAVVGKRRVRIACYEAQGPGAPVGDTLGALLIPEKYTSFETSELVVDIKPGGNEPLEFNLTDH